MKDYIDYDEEVGFESDDSDENNVDELDSENFYNMKQKNKGNKKKMSENTKFDEAAFDEKVARVLVRIHKTGRKKKGDEKFSKWVEENLFHLQNMYSLSNLECTAVDFYTYVYENSKN